MFLGIFEIFKEDLLVPTICIIVLGIFIIITTIFLSIKNNSVSDLYNVVVPDYKDIEKEKNDKSFIDDKTKRKKKEKESFFKKKGLDVKVRRAFIRAGKYDKTIEDLFSQMLKTALLGLVMSFSLFYILKNPLVFLIILVAIFLPIINLIADIQERESKFRAEFPYFLKTLSFVLANGSNMAIAFEETVNRQQDGILKEVMSDVLSTQRVNGGDFGSAFSTILEKVECDETKEFVEVVQSNLEKGVSIAEIFSVQSESIDRFITNKKRKKIKSISNKMMIPILIALGAIMLLMF